MGCVATKERRDRARKSASEVHLALLRGINVGGKNKLPMKDLIAIFGEAGCGATRSYIQSGNVVFRASSTVAQGVAEAVSRIIEDRFGYQVPVIVRSGKELRKVVAANPFLPAVSDTSKLHVAFLAHRPKRAAIDALDPERSPPDTFRLCDHEIYLHCPKGFGRTKLTNGYFERTLGIPVTVRNWRTVSKLVQLVDEA